MHLRRLPLSAPLTGLAAAAALACGEGRAGAPAEGAANAPAAAATPAPSPVAASAPAGGGTVTFSLEGGATPVRGEGPATRCGGPFNLATNKGVFYEGVVAGHRISMGDWDRRQGGTQQLAREGAGWDLAIAGPNGTNYSVVDERPATIQVSDDFKRAEMTATVEPFLKKGGASSVRIVFVCS